MGTYYETQVGLHTNSNGGQNTASESGKLLGALQAWSVQHNYSKNTLIASDRCLQSKTPSVSRSIHADGVRNNVALYV